MISLFKIKSTMSEVPKTQESSVIQKKPTGRPKGAGGNNVVKAGKIIEVVEPTEQVNEADPIPISLTAARKLMKKTTTPRVISPEVKAKMLANLAAGRQKRKEMIEAAKLQLEQAKEKAKPEIVIKKYVIKPNQFLKRKRQEIEKAKQDVPEQQMDDSSIVETDDFTGAETDMELYKKIKRQERLLKKIKQIKQTVEPTPVPVAKPQPMVRMYNPFY
jgi:hypothetical protein